MPIEAMTITSVFWQITGNQIEDMTVMVGCLFLCIQW